MCRGSGGSTLRCLKTESLGVSWARDVLGEGLRPPQRQDKMAIVTTLARQVLHALLTWGPEVEAARLGVGEGPFTRGVMRRLCAVP